MNKWLFALCLPLFALFCLLTVDGPDKRLPASPLPQVARRANIMLILADDLGFSDLGCYGSEIHTPNLDYLANNCIRYTQFYNTSRCCPTRASLLTGLYNQQAGIGRMTDDDNAPGYRGHLTENTVTLAEVLKSAGYQTAMTANGMCRTPLCRKTRRIRWTG